MKWFYAMICDMIWFVFMIEVRKKISIQLTEDIQRDRRKVWLFLMLDIWYKTNISTENQLIENRDLK